MDAIANTVIGAGIALVGAFLTQLLSMRYQTKLARENAEIENHRKRQEFLATLMQRMITASEKYQAWLGHQTDYKVSPVGLQQHSEIIGAAVAACVASGEIQLQAMGEKELFPYPYVGDYESQNRKTLLKAISHMSALIKL